MEYICTMRGILFILFLLISSIVFGQHQDKVDFIRADVHVIPNPKQKSVRGTITYDFKVLSNVDSVFLDAHQMAFEKVVLNSKNIAVKNTKKQLILHHKFRAGKNYRLQLNYSCTPKQALYFVGFDDDVLGNEQIWTQGQGKYTSNWLPSFDAMTQKVEFDLGITFDENYTAVSNGKLLNVKVENNLKTWQYNMENPMSSYLVAFAIGNYKKQKHESESGILLENYFYPEDVNKVEPTYRYTKQIFDFLEQEIGVPYPWQNYKQVPVHDFLYAGMENTSITLFSDDFMIDSTAFVDKNYVNINAHELAHQWFGNLVTEESSEHHWLQEGFATYFAYLAEKEIFGDDYFYWKLFNTAKSLKELSDSGAGESLLNPKASSLTFYEKGAWALVLLRDEIGITAFRKGIYKYLTKYQFKNVKVMDFIKEMEGSSNKDLAQFKKDWLESTVFPWECAHEYLVEQSNSIKKYDEVQQASTEIKYVYKDDLLEQFWTTDTTVNLKRQVIFDLCNRFTDQNLAILMHNEPVEVRQALALSKDKISPALKPVFESMLYDKSYITIEAALYKLWAEFSQKRSMYLDTTKDVIGLPNKNVRLLWLTLALVTPEYHLNEKPIYLLELHKYTSSIFNPEVRQSAFRYLNEIGMLNGKALENLIKASNHHSWQFRNFSRRMLDKMLKDENLKGEIVSVAQDMHVADLSYLKTKLELP